MIGRPALAHWAVILATGLALMTPMLPRAGAAKLRLAIEGVSDDLADSARSSLTISQYLERDISESAARQLAVKGEAEIRHALEPFGFYDATVASRVRPGANGTVEVRFNVTPGEPVRVRRVEIELTDEARQVAEIGRAAAALEPKKGEPFDHQAYEQSKVRIVDALRSAGYLQARATRSRVSVLAALRAADIDLAWEMGERHRFGEVEFAPSQFSEGFLRSFIPWEENDYYSARSLLRLQQRLVGMDYFSSVSVMPLIEEAQDGIVPVEVGLTPAKRTVYTAGLFVSTDSGVGGRLGVDRRWVNRRGHKARAEVAYAQRRQTASVDYRIPRPGPEPRDFTFGAAYTNEETAAVESENLRIAAAMTRRNWRGFTRTLGLHFIDGDFEIAEQRGSSRMLYAEAALSRRRVNEERYTGRGYSLRLTLRGAPEMAITDTSFIAGLVNGEWTQPVGQGRIILRTELGAMMVEDFHDLPPELRFFAGGDRSVRGFGFQAIGDTNAEGGIVGGKFLTTGSVEYERFFRPQWGTAVFVDAGDAFRSEPALNLATGVGVRWKSPVGIVRLDFARPVISDHGNNWRVHLVIGPNL